MEFIIVHIIIKYRYLIYHFLCGRCAGVVRALCGRNRVHTLCAHCAALCGRCAHKLARPHNARTTPAQRPHIARSSMTQIGGPNSSGQKSLASRRFPKSEPSKIPAPRFLKKCCFVRALCAQRPHKTTNKKGPPPSKSEHSKI